MDEIPEVEVKLWELVEILLLRAIAQRVVLEKWTADDEDWKPEVERAEILNAPKIRSHFDELRASLYGLSPQSPRATDWSLIVDLIDKENF